MFFVSTVLGEKSSEVDQSWVASAKLPGRRPPPHWTGRGPVKKGIMIGELSGFFFCFFFFFFFFLSFSGLCWSICCTLSQMFSVRSVLGDKASVVEQVPSFLKIGHQHTAQEEDQSTKASCLVSWAFCCCCFCSSFFFRSLHGCMGMDVWVNVFRMPFLRADCGPWRKMSRAWPAMSAITTSSGSTCPSHQESAWVAVEAIHE